MRYRRSGQIMVPGVIQQKNKSVFGCLFGRKVRENMNKKLTVESIDENVIIFRVTKYQPGMSVTEIYDLVRTCWKVNVEKARKADLAFAVYKGIVLEVYRIDKWVPGHSTYNSIPVSDEIERRDRAEGRWEFVGRVAEDIREKYVEKNVSGFFKRGNQSPFIYIYRK